MLSKNVFIKLFRIGRPVFRDADRQVATVVMETVQLVLSQFKYF